MTPPQSVTVSRPPGRRQPAKGLKPQTREVLRFLESGAELTSKHARTFWGIDRLAARIHELRRANYPVRCRRAAGGYGVYRMEVSR